MDKEDILEKNEQGLNRRKQNRKVRKEAKHIQHEQQNFLLINKKCGVNFSSIEEQVVDAKRT